MAGLDELNAKLNRVEGQIERINLSLERLRERFIKAFEAGEKSHLPNYAERIVRETERLNQLLAQREKIYSQIFSTPIAPKELEPTLKAIDALQNKLNLLYKQRGSAGLEGIGKELELEITRAEKALSALISKLRSLRPVPAAEKINLPQPTPLPTLTELGRRKLEEEYRKKLEIQRNLQEAAAQRTLREVAGQEFIQELRNLFQGFEIPPSKTEGISKIPIEDITTLYVDPAKQKKLDEEARKAKLQSLLTQERYRQALSLAEMRGFSRQDLKEVLEIGLSGIQRVSFEKIDELTGKLKRLRLFVDEAGRAIPSTSRQFQTFFQGVARDIGELTRWMIALSVIYWPLQRLSDLTRDVVENQAKLADAMVVTSNAALTASEIFDIAAEAASQMGEDVGDVIVNFSQAYQAAGDVADASQRVTVATKLMSDALVLSKLSSLSAAESIDTLAAALRQAGLGLDQGMILLDKWVKTSKVANVDIATLAVGFSVVGEQADAAGLSIEELNAVLAVTAETLDLKGREAANAVRAFISGFQSDKAIKELEKYGIAVTDMRGNIRNLLELQRTLYEYRQAGIISGADFSRISAAIGGGSRRAAAVAGFIGAYPRISEIVREQQDAQGMAAQALAIKLDTAQSSIIRFNNALKSIAQTLGDEGGLLDLFSIFIDMAAGLVKVLDNLLEVTGKAGPLLLGTLVGWKLYARHRGPLATTKTALGVAEFFGYTPEVFQKATLGGLTLRQQIGKLAYEMVLAETPRGKMLGSIGAGLAISALPAILNMRAEVLGEDPYGREKAIFGTAGSILGAAASSFILKQSPIVGAAIGQAAGISMVEAATKRLTFSDYYGKPLPIRGEERPAYAFEQENVARLLGGPVKQLFAQLSAGLINFSLDLWGSIFGGFPEEFSGMTKATPLMLMEAMASEEQKLLFRQRMVEAIKSGEMPVTPEEINLSEYSRQVAEFSEKYRSLITLLRTRADEELLDKLVRGAIRPSEYIEKLDVLEGFASKASTYIAVFGEEFIKLSDDIKNTEEAYRALLDIMLYGAPEQVINITKMASEVGDLMVRLEQLKKMGAPAEDILEIQDQIERRVAAGGRILEGMYRQAYLQKTPPPQIINLHQPLAASLDTIKNLIVDARRLESDYLRQAAGYTESAIESYRENLEDFAIAIGDGSKLVFRKLSDFGEGLVGREFFNLMLERYKEQGLLFEQTTRGPGFQTFNFPSSQLPAFERWIQYYQNLLIGAGVPVQTEPGIIAMFSDDQFATLHYDLTAINLAQNKMVELQQKQLEQGMWNIPEGQFFWIPVQSYVPAGGGVREPALPRIKKKGEEITQKEEISIPPLPPPTIQIEANLQDRDIAVAAEKVKRIFENLGTVVPGTAPRAKQRPLKEDLETVMPGRAPRALPTSPLWFDEESLTFPTGGRFMPKIPARREKPLEGLPKPGLPQLATVRETPPAPKVDMRISHTTNVFLDGKQIATIIKTYFERDLGRVLSSYGKSSKDFVIR